MSRLIDADMLKTWFDNHYDDEEVTVGFVSGLIDEQLTVDAVPVIRCKDCKHCQEERLFDSRKVLWLYCDRYNVEIVEDDFCSRAERRSDE